MEPVFNSFGGEYVLSLLLLLNPFSNRLRIYPDELRVSLEYRARMERFAPPDVDSVAGPASVCLLVKTYSGFPEKFSYETT